MNIAILLGVSEYVNEQNLPACKKDLEFMSELIKATGKYASVLCISENTGAANVKEKITNKISDLGDKEIEEIFFYFTGHGDFYKNEFYYVLTDFDKDKRKQTSLENLEVDNWFRSLNPEITIKIVDACHAGVVYVKEEENKLQNYLNKSQGKFNKCYFMFSSNSNQSSYQDDNLSFFTKSFINSVKSHNARDIRFKDIIDYVSDDFDDATSDQTPFFVTQADYTEKFCSINSEIKNLFSKPADEELKSEENSKPEMEMKTLESIIKADAKSYITGEEVSGLLDEIQKKTVDKELPEVLISLYEIQYKFDEIPWLPKEGVIGKWFEENENDYFVHIVYDDEYYEEDVPTTDEDGKMTGDFETIKGFRKTNEGFYPSVELPYSYIEITAKPIYHNIPCFKCMMPFAFSKTEIRFFYCFATYKDVNWNKREIIREDIKWFTSIAKFGDTTNIFAEIFHIQDKFFEFIMDYLREKFEKNEL